MKKTVSQIVSIVLYVVAACYFIFAIWSTVEMAKFIADGLSAGQLSWTSNGGAYNILAYIMQYGMLNLFYSAVSLGLGILVYPASSAKKDNAKKKKNAEEKKSIVKDEKKKNAEEKKPIVKDEKKKKESN